MLTLNSLLLLTILVTALATSWGLTWATLGYLRQHAILDQPNERSSHTAPTPRGGGWGILMTLLPVFALLSWMDARLPEVAPIFVGVTLLTATSWIDDRRGLPASARLLAHSAAVAIGLAALPSDAFVFQGWLPWAFDRLVAALAWVWFVNLYNFMDGIDGLAGTETATLGLGMALVGLAAGLKPFPIWLGVALAGAALGFLIWNWQPARIFMGDVGSVPLGYLIGWLLLGLATQGLWVAALILPAYYLADATLTLLRRLLRGERVWQAHREHFYQRAVRAGRSHSQVVGAVLVTNAALVALAVISVHLGWLVLIPSALAVAALLFWLARPVHSCAS